MAVENIVDQPESPQYSDHEELIDIMTRSPEESGDTDDKLAVETMVNQPESPQHSDHDDFIDIVGDDHPETVVNQPESPQHSDQEDLIDVVGDDQPETVVNQPESPQHSDPEELIDVVCDDQPADAERSLEVNVTSEETGDIDNSMAVEAGTDEPESPQLSDPEELIDVVRLDDKSDVTRSPEVNRTSQARETSVVTSSEEHVSSSTRGGEKETTTALCPSSTTQHAVEDSILCAANTAQQTVSDAIFRALNTAHQTVDESFLHYHTTQPSQDHLPPPPETTASGRLHSDFSAGCTGVTDTPTQTSRQIRQKRPRPGDNDDTDEEESSDDDADDSSDDLLQAALRLFNKDDGRRFQERHEAQKRTHSGALKEHPHSMAAEGKENRRDSACVGHEDGERSSRKHKSKKHKKKKAKRDGKTHQLCKVCGDRASGKHYGVISCDGCRGFFKRAIRKKMGRLYRCKDNNSCVVDVSRRNQCQACRYRRCMEVKMNPNAVQKERSPRPPRDEGQIPTAIVPPELGSGPYPHLLSNCSSSFLCPYPGAPYPYPSNLYYASASLYPRLAALQYQHQAGLPPALANHLPSNAHVVLPSPNGGPEAGKRPKLDPLAEEKEADEKKKRHGEDSSEDEEVDVVEKSPDSTTEKDESKTHPKTPDSGNVTGSPPQNLSLNSSGQSPGNENSSPSTLNSTHSPETGNKAPAADNPKSTPTTSKASAFVVPASLPWTSPMQASSSASPLTSLPTPKLSPFVSVSSQHHPHLTSGASVYQSSHPGSALHYPGSHAALGFVPKPGLSLPLPFPGMMPLSLPPHSTGSSPVNPGKLPVFAHAQLPLPPVHMDTAASLAAAAAAISSPFASSARPFPFATHLAPTPTPGLIPWPTPPTAGSAAGATPQLSETEELQIATHALRVLQANIRWVAGLPTFSSLSGRDQLALLEQSWSELLVLSALQSNQLAELVCLVSASSVPNKEKVTMELMSIASRAHSLAIDGEEFNLLRCLALFRPERTGLSDPRTVEALQENATMMLNQHIQNMVPPVHMPGLRHTKMLLLVTAIEQLNADTLGKALFGRIPNALPVDSLIVSLCSMAVDRR